MDKQPITPTSHEEMLQKFPDASLLEGWYFRGEEVFVGVFIIEGSDIYGHRVSKMCFGDTDAAMQECIAYARQISQSNPPAANNAL